jgi:hypothetical protein
VIRLGVQLRTPAADTPPARVTMASCIGCGRIEAPQQRIGVCIRRPEELVSAAVYDEARRLAALGAHGGVRHAARRPVAAHLGRAERSRARSLYAQRPG